MIKKIILVMFIFSFSSHCGFTPLYSNKSEVNFSIISIELEGDKTINNYLKIIVNIKMIKLVINLLLK